MLQSTLLLALAAGAAPAGPDEPLRYVVTPDFAAHTWHVRATFPHAAGAPCDFWMARWTAGAYHLAEYGHFVTELRASAPDGHALPAARDGENHWSIDAGEAAAVVVDYSARACAPSMLNENMVLDVEGSRLAKSYGFLSPCSLLGFVKGLTERRVELDVELPSGWKTATALVNKREHGFIAPSWWRLEDSPLLFSPDLDTETFEVDGIPHSVTVYGKGAAVAHRIADDCEKLVKAARDWMQGLPYQRYHFLLGFVPEAGGGSGLEHTESTLILVTPGMQPGPLLDHMIAHEYFHCWCAERIHVQELERPDYTRPLHTGTLWVNEGITEYFSHLVEIRAGLLERDRFLNELWSTALAMQMVSQHSGKGSDGEAWTDVSRATADWKDENDLIRFAMKHYETGPLAILALDLEMRRASHGERGIADLLRFLERAYAERGRGFGEDEMPALIDGIAQADLDDFYDRCIDGGESPDLERELDVIGYAVQERNGGEPGPARIVPVEHPTPAQLKARERLFAPDVDDG